MTMTPDIYSFLKKLGRPSVLPGRWQGLSQADPPFFCLGLEFQELVDQLRTSFKDRDLVKARVLEQAADGAWELRPSLRGEYLLLLCPQHKPFTPQLVTATEVLPALHAPYQTLLQDRRLHELMQQRYDEEGNWRYLAITPTLTDTAILWRLGLPAVPLAALAELNAAGLVTLKRLLQQILQRQKRQPGDSLLSLVVVTCSLAAWDFTVQPGTDAVIDLLQRLQDHLHLDLRTVLWQPRDGAVESFETALRFQDCAALRSAIQFGFEHESTVLTIKKQIPYECSTEPQSYADSVFAWINSHHNDRNTQEQLLQRFEQYSDRQLIQPLLKLAEQAEDPMTANLIVSLAHVCRCSEQIAAKLLAPLQRADLRPHGLRPDYKALRDDQQSLCKQQMALCQAIREQSHAKACK